MFRQIYKKAAILCLLFVLASILVCGICMVSAEESPHLDLENAPDVTLTYDEIADKQGIILNEAAIEPNLRVLSQYLHNDCGVILVPNRAPGNVLGWTLTSVNNGDYELSPFYLYNSDVDKNNVDYTEELSSLIRQSSCAMIVNMWDPSFSERGILVSSGKSYNIPTNDTSDQGFGDYDVYSNLPNRSVLGPGLWFTD